MAIKYDRSVEDAILEYVKLAEIWFSKKYLDQAAFEARLRAGLSFTGPDPHIESKIQLATNSLGLFSIELFQAMISGGEPFKSMLVSIMWDRLLSAGLLIKAFAHMTGTPFADHQIDQQVLTTHLNDGTFSNLFVTPSRLPDIYAHAVAAVDVKKDLDLARGTGFVISHEGAQFFVTCKHNVDPEDGISVKSITSATGGALCIEQIELSDRYDIAVARMKHNIAGRAFALSDAVEVFDEVFTLGYPLVPRAESILVGHRGEVNARAHLYVEKCPVLLISNLVSPGNSGGPVLTRTGHCVGMTISWLEAEQRTNKSEGDVTVERMRFSAAIPAHLIREAIRALPKLAT